MLRNARIQIDVRAGSRMISSHIFNAGDPDFEYVAESLERSLLSRGIRYERKMFPVFTLTILAGGRSGTPLRQLFRRILPEPGALEIDSALAGEKNPVVDISVF